MMLIFVVNLSHEGYFLSLQAHSKRRIMGEIPNVTNVGDLLWILGVLK